MNDSTCKACSGTWLKADHFIADLGLTRAYLHDDQFFPGWTVLVFCRHATELFHLAPTERIQLMEEVNLVATVLGQVYEAWKIPPGLWLKRCEDAYATGPCRKQCGNGA